MGVVTREVDKGLLISISGPSGVGKGTVLAEVRKLFPNSRHSISVTTRAPRGQEQEGVEYYFRSKEEFEQMVRDGEIIEYDTYVDNYYGTPLSPLVKMSSEGQDVLLDITIAGSLALKDKYNEAVTVFILPPSFEELGRRLRGRGTETEELIAKRLAKAKEEVLDADKFDYVIVNDDLEQATKDLAAIINAEKCRYSRHIGIENQL